MDQNITSTLLDAGAYKADERSVTDAKWGHQKANPSDCLDGNGWRLDVTAETGKKWLAIFLDSEYYVQRIVYTAGIGSYPATNRVIFLVLTYQPSRTPTH